ncbi:MAG: O-antigen ligase family protein [bacterium]|nr:MAG: O-antigen ligase family protein [bacterium]
MTQQQSGQASADPTGQFGSRARSVLFILLATILFFSTFSIAGTQITLALAFLLWLVIALVSKRFRFAGTMLDLPIFLFIATSLAAAIFSDERYASILGLKNLLLASVVYLFTFNVRDRTEVRRLLIVLFLSGTASAVYGIVIYAMGHGDGGLGRTPGSFSIAMTFGGVMLVLCSLALGPAIGSSLQWRLRLPALSMVSIGLVALLLSFTRSSWVGMVAAAVVVFSILRKRWLIPLIGCMIVLYLVLPDALQQRVSTIWDPTYRTNIHRMQLFRGGVKIFYDYPVLGVGTRDLGELYRRYKPPEAVYIYGHMHNIFLQVAVTTGIVGLAAFCYLLISCFRLLIANLRLGLPPPDRAWVAGSIGALVGFIVNGLFEWNFGDAEVVTLFYIMLGMNCAIPRIHIRKCNSLL